MRRRILTGNNSTKSIATIMQELGSNVLIWADAKLNTGTTQNLSSKLLYPRINNTDKTFYYDVWHSSSNELTYHGNYYSCNIYRSASQNSYLLTAGNVCSLGLGTDNFTYGVTLSNIEAVNESFEYVFGMYDGVTNRHAISVTYSDGKIVPSWWHTSYSSSSEVGTTDISGTDIKTLIVTRNNGVIKYYVNGNLEMTINDTASINGTSQKGFSYSHGYCIGCQNKLHNHGGFILNIGIDQEKATEMSNALNRYYA